MEEWRNPSKWLIPVLGGTIAAVAAAYFLYVFPPERTLGEPDVKPVASSDPSKEETGGPDLGTFQEASASQKPERLDTLVQTSDPSDSAVPAPTRGPAETDTVASERMPQSESRQEELRPEPPVSRGQTGVNLLSPDSPLVFPQIDTVVSVAFRETLGSRYAEFVVDTPGQKSFRFPARSAGATKEFEVGGQHYEIRVIAIDWQTRTSHIMLRPAVGS